MAGGAADTPPDLLAPMAAATRITSRPATLILVSSGLSTAGAFDLRQVGWEARAEVVAAELKGRGQLPVLRGWTIVFAGLAARRAASQACRSLSAARWPRTRWPSARLRALPGASRTIRPGRTGPAAA